MHTLAGGAATAAFQYQSSSSSPGLHLSVGAVKMALIVWCCGGGLLMASYASPFDENDEGMARLGKAPAQRQGKRFRRIYASQ